MKESWRTGKDLVGKSAEYVGFVGSELDWGRSPFFCWGDSLLDSYASRPVCNHRTLKIVEMDKIVSGKRSWMTRGLIEYAWWGDRPPERAIV